MFKICVILHFSAHFYLQYWKKNSGQRGVNKVSGRTLDFTLHEGGNGTLPPSPMPTCGYRTLVSGWSLVYVYTHVCGCLPVSSLRVVPHLLLDVQEDVPLVLVNQGQLPFEKKNESVKQPAVFFGVEINCSTYAEEEVCYHGGVDGTHETVADSDSDLRCLIVWDP